MELTSEQIASYISNMQAQLQSVEGLVRRKEHELNDAEAQMHRLQGALELTGSMKQQAEQQKKTAAKKAAEADLPVVEVTPEDLKAIDDAEE